MFKPLLGPISALVIALALLPSVNSSAAPNNIQIEGDSAIFDQASKTITYAGSVTATQGNLVIEGDKLTVALIADEVDTIRTTGSPAKFSLLQGLVDANIKQPDNLKASALTIVFAPATSQLQLLGNATLRQGGNIIRSNEIIYNVEAQQIRASGDSDRVRMEFEISDQSPSATNATPELP